MDHHARPILYWASVAFQRIQPGFKCAMDGNEDIPFKVRKQLSWHIIIRCLLAPFQTGPLVQEQTERARSGSQNEVQTEAQAQKKGTRVL